MTWPRLIDLVTLARRPLVFVDFETAGLNAAPPVEFAMLVWAPWLPPEMDAVSVQARAASPPGLTSAAVVRMNPGVGIEPEAFAKHAISLGMLKDAPRYNDPGIVGFFDAYATGSVDDNEGPALWCGHNIAEADLPWAKRWGYFPTTEPCLGIDTMRLQKRLEREHPFPLAPDGFGLAADTRASNAAHCPAIANSLEPYRFNLAGLSTAMLGEPSHGAHGALSDCKTAAWCASAMLHLWSPLWTGAVRGEDPAKALSLLLADFNRPPPDLLSWDGLVRVHRPDTHPTDPEARAAASKRQPGLLDTPRYTWNFGKYKGATVGMDSYSDWVIKTFPRLPNGLDGERWCSAETVAMLTGHP